jgi:hypothetical protein
MLQPVHEDRKFLGSGWQAQEATAEIIHQGTEVADRVANAVARINRKAKKVGSTERGGRALDRKTYSWQGGRFI